ncbi:MAG: hypothetical protein ABIY52_19415 [Gemmatimonadaceae bacterium]
MPESYEIDVPNGIVTCRAWGEFTNEELRGHYRRLLADPQFHSRYCQLGDVCGVTTFTVDSETIEATARMGVFDAGVPRAFVAPPGVGYGLARMFSAYAQSQGQALEVFHDLATARAWMMAHPNRCP